LFGLTNHIIDQEQYTILVTAVMICVEETQWIPGSREEVIGDK
jgi:hypothetical protein